MNTELTDPFQALAEGPFDWARKDKVEVVGQDVDLSNVKDVTPSPEDPAKASLLTLVNLYNESDPTTQWKFIELLVKHEEAKIKEILGSAI